MSKPYLPRKGGKRRMASIIRWLWKQPDSDPQKAAFLETFHNKKVVAEYRERKRQQEDASAKRREIVKEEEERTNLFTSPTKDIRAIVAEMCHVPEAIKPLPEEMMEWKLQDIAMDPPVVKSWKHNPKYIRHQKKLDERKERMFELFGDTSDILEINIEEDFKLQN